MQTTYTLVTGASSPIGSAIARDLAPARKLILHGRDAAKLRALRDSCANSREHLVWELDLASTDQIAQSLSTLLTEHEAFVASFVHCAGAMHLGAFRLLSATQEVEMFAVNVFSAIEIVRVLRRKKPNQAALSDVVFISSAASLAGEKGNAAYTAAKGALDSYMKSLAMELSPSGRANSVLPGMVDGGMSDFSRSDPGYEQVIRANYPLGLGRPPDVSGTVAFLLSNQARWITGQQILVDGGYSAHCNHVL